jgi:transposase-like protein
VFPKTVVQTCVVHLIRYSMHFASWKERRLIAAALRPIYQAESAALARERLDDFDRGAWGRKYRAIAQSWRRNSEQVIPFFAFAPELRTMLYTTNAIESLNAQVQGGKSARPFSQRGSRCQTHLAGAAQGSGALEKSAGYVAGCQNPTSDPVRGQIQFGRVN